MKFGLAKFVSRVARSRTKLAVGHGQGPELEMRQVKGKAGPKLETTLSQLI